MKSQPGGCVRQRPGGGGKPDQPTRRVLLITCSDIGADPYALLGGERSDVYVIQNAGALVLPNDPDVEFVLGRYDVQEVILCGHSGCGVLRQGRPGPASAAGAEAVNGQHTTRHLLAQFDNLLTLPEAARRQAAGALALSCWAYDDETGQILQYDLRTRAFGPRSR